MWTPHVIVSSSDGPSDLNPTRPVIAGYALGWQIQDFRGRRLVSHSGGLSGQVTQTALMPSAGVGVEVFSNTEDSVSGGVRNAILDHLCSGRRRPNDWVANYVARAKLGRENAVAAIASSDMRPPARAPSLPLAAYAGRHHDAWYGGCLVR